MNKEYPQRCNYSKKNTKLHRVKMYSTKIQNSLDELGRKFEMAEESVSFSTGQ